MHGSDRSRAASSVRRYSVGVEFQSDQASSWFARGLGPGPRLFLPRSVKPPPHLTRTTRPPHQPSASPSLASSFFPLHHLIPPSFSDLPRSPALQLDLDAYINPSAMHHLSSTHRTKQHQQLLLAAASDLPRRAITIFAYTYTNIFAASIGIKWTP